MDLECLHPAYSFYHNDCKVGQFKIVNRDNHREIWCLEIFGEFRGMGLGQQMLKELVEMFSDMALELGCGKNNKKALHIYQKFGFKIIKDSCYYYWMRKEI
jgi:ribosomal protein S18 acetylase RimI-like enzyme